MRQVKYQRAALGLRALSAVMLLVSCAMGNSPRIGNPDAYDDGLEEKPDLVVSDVIEISGTSTLMAYRNIVFKPGGKIRVKGGSSLVVWARAISSNDGAVVEFDGVGEPGAPGGVGAKCIENDCNDWWTDNKDDWEKANRNCLPSEYGQKGEPGGEGGAGARISIHVSTLPIAGTFKCNVEGGVGGPGGNGGPGRWHILNTGGLPRHQCGNLGAGAAGPRGLEGTCIISELAPPRKGD